MALNLQQVLKQTQRLVMTPQLQQSIKLLQLNALELEQLTEQELLENPFLTADEEEANEDEKPAEAATETEAETAITPPPDPKPEAEPDPTPNDLTAEPEHFQEVDVNWDEFYSDAGNAPYVPRDPNEEAPDFQEYVSAPTSLGEHLLWQLRCCVLNGRDVEIGEYLIGCVDDDGFIAPESVDEAVERFHVTPDRVERVLSVLQEFEPIGVMARSLAESLLLQMDARGMATQLARPVLTEHLEAFERKKFPEIARALEVEESQLVDLFHRIARLEPHPGRSISGESIHYVRPDVFVKIVDDELMIYLNEGRGGRLSVSRIYRRWMRLKRAAMTDKEREYAQEKYRAALSLIKNIERRKSTILRVTESIMRHQREFLERGIEALRPLTLHEVADEIEMHESTVARVTSRKYVETPQGTYPLKFFFSSSIESRGAEAVSSRAVKDRIARIIEAEDPRKPLSDQKIANTLEADGFKIARRTVAKYRDQLKILSAKLRRQA